MDHLTGHRRIALLVASLGALALLIGTVGTAGAAAPIPTETIEFQETETGSTFAFVDNAPKTTLRHGFPVEISAGDQIVLTTPLLKSGKRAGKLLAHCTATATSKSFDGAGFSCLGTFVFGSNTMTVSAVIGAQSHTVGTVLGGTGIYAGAKGTLESKEVKGPVSPVTVNLYE